MAEPAPPPEATSSDGLPPVVVVGLHGGQWFGMDALAALRATDVLVGAARLHHDLDTVLAAHPHDGGGPQTAERVELFGPLEEVIDLIEARRAEGARVTMLASGDPGFFGIERLLVGRFGTAVEVHPAPSSVALAFARARVHWDDAAVVSVHGRSLERALPHILEAPKVAVLVSKSTPPETLGKALLAAGAEHRHAVVCSRLGQPDESITRTDLDGLAAGTFDPLSVVVLTGEAQPMAVNAIVAWGRPTSAYRHRAGMITKPEVRAAALSKLDLFGAAVLWDVGASSGSVGIEAARLAPGCRVYAIERNPEDCERIRANASRVAVGVVEGTAPDAFAPLPDPDRVFVGGGGIDVWRAAHARLRSSGVLVGTFATLDTALAAVDHLGPAGELAQVSVSRGVRIGPDDQLRLEADNPVFIVWGIRD
ncbi:MAG: precorrin-6y C5,15-methyltransferase (decarboxylating) subunit CbiE [Actinomycetota bacterium]